MKSIFSWAALFLFFALYFSGQSAFAQMFILHDVKGQPIKKGVYENVVGSPYAYEDWSEGKLVLANGDKYEGIMLKYDLVQNMLLYKNEEGQAMEFVSPVHEFTLNEGREIYRNAFSPVDNHPSSAFYQILWDGKIKLLKKRDKVVREEKAYGNATITKNIVENINYYIEVENQLLKVKNEKSLVEAFPRHSSSLKNFVRENKLNEKKEADLIEIIKYCSTLE